MVDIDNTIADYTNGLRDYIRECGRGEDECPCPEPTAYDFTLTGGWPFSGDAKAFTSFRAGMPGISMPGGTALSFRSKSSFIIRA